MTSTWTADTFSQPPSYEETERTGEVAVGGNLTFVDFWPDCCKVGFFGGRKYEKFQILIDHGNEWLRSHPQWKVQTCESVEYALGRSIPDTQKMTYFDSGKYATWYIRGLRLWIVPSTEIRGQQIGCINLMPERLDGQGIFSSPSYESLDEVLEKFNTMIRTNPLPGKIINVETQEMKVGPRTFDPDRSTWMEDGDVGKRFLFILRVFFEISSSIVEPIGVMDFTPEKLTEGGVCSLPEYELFNNVISKAAIWCKQQTTIRICNAQTLEIKFKRGDEFNSHKMNYSEYGRRAYVRILRIVFIKEQNYETEIPKSLIYELTRKVFVPVQLTSSCLGGEFETLDQTKKRMEEWIKFTGARVISTQTLAIRFVGGNEAIWGTEVSSTDGSSRVSSVWIFVICLYLNGFYHEPPEEVMPPVPEIQKRNCCVLI